MQLVVAFEVGTGGFVEDKVIDMQVAKILGCDVRAPALLDQQVPDGAWEGYRSLADRDGHGRRSTKNEFG